MPVIVHVAMVGGWLTAVFGQQTWYMLKLNGGVMNSKAAKHFMDAFQNAIAG